MPTRIVISPGKYIQGPGALEQIASHAEGYGEKAFIVSDEFVMAMTKKTVNKSFSDSPMACIAEVFRGECTKPEIMRLKTIAHDKTCDVVVGIGGGKTLDAAKAVAFHVRKPVIVVPTIASTDAPTSALSILYTEDGVFDEVLMLPKNPEVVLVDTKIIAEAPVRLLVSGMGDALATYFEARAVRRSNALTMSGERPTETAFALAELCYETLLADGVKAIAATESKVPSKALENIVEANTYLSGIGFESGGLAAAHAIHNGFTVLKQCRSLYHGEKVAFGVLVQLLLENAPIEEIEEVVAFCKRVGLPTTLKELNADTATREQLMDVARAATAETETIHNMPFDVCAEDVYAAIIAADKLGTTL